MDIVEFWTLLPQREPGSCWEWQGTRKKHGYGFLRLGGRYSHAHRVAYEATIGPIPPGKLLRHKCDNPPCCNPEHLEPGTHLDNARDRMERNRSARQHGSTHGGSKLTAEQVLYIRSQRGLKFQRVLAAEFGVTQNLISKIQLGQMWKVVI